MAEARTKYDNEEQFIKAVSNLTMLSNEERGHLAQNPK